VFPDADALDRKFSEPARESCSPQLHLRVEKLLAEARMRPDRQAGDGCSKRGLFEKLARDYREMARNIERIMALADGNKFQTETLP
jgi:hypothetical protein